MGASFTSKRSHRNGWICIIDHYSVHSYIGAHHPIVAAFLRKLKSWFISLFNQIRRRRQFLHQQSPGIGCRSLERIEVSYVQAWYRYTEGAEGVGQGSARQSAIVAEPARNKFTLAWRRQRWSTQTTLKRRLLLFLSHTIYIIWFIEDRAHNFAICMRSVHSNIRRARVWCYKHYKVLC